jgi:hypothetical protein
VAKIAASDAPGKPIEIWFQDEARIGQKNKITRLQAKPLQPVALVGMLSAPAVSEQLRTLPPQLTYPR